LKVHRNKYTCGQDPKYVKRRAGWVGGQVESEKVVR